MQLSTLFFIGSISLFLARIIKYDSKLREFHFVALDFISLMLFVAFFYFASFPPTGVIAYTVGSQGYVFLLLLTIFYSIILAGWGFADLLHALGKL